MRFLKKVAIEASDVWVLLELNSKSDPRVSVYKSQQAAKDALEQRRKNQKEHDPGNRADSKFYLIESSLV